VPFLFNNENDDQEDSDDEEDEKDEWFLSKIWN